MKYHPSFYAVIVCAVGVLAVFAVVLALGGHGGPPSYGGYWALAAIAFWYPDPPRSVG